MIDQAHAERMRDALAWIVVGLQAHVEDASIPPDLDPSTIVWIAKRALDPDEWERVHEGPL